MIKFNKLIARESVVFSNLETGETVDTQMTPGEIVMNLPGATESFFGIEKHEFAKQFVKAANEDKEMAFIQNYDFWIGRVKDGNWTQEMLDERMKKLHCKDQPIENLAGLNWPELIKLTKA